ncbi:hypothetical protein EZV62_027401 [Acer yangbiense]|uniref:Uncharacterized protein n=1 Tax=Acer yangbiense TaxID=1000413 RepID=A0A5C7GUI6_9ROSI|nr:hypothetical protein EZV62_027401 [Acer yangbiense]
MFNNYKWKDLEDWKKSKDSDVEKKEVLLTPVETLALVSQEPLSTRLILMDLKKSLRSGMTIATTHVIPGRLTRSSTKHQSIGSPETRPI